MSVAQLAELSAPSQEAWATIKAALDGLFDLKEDALHREIPVTISHADFMAFYIAANNWASSSPQDRSCAVNEIWPRLEAYFAKVCTGIHTRLAGIELPSALVPAYASLYKNYMARLPYLMRSFKYAESTVLKYASEAGLNKELWSEDREDVQRQLLVSPWDLPVCAAKGGEQWTSTIIRSQAEQDPTETPLISLKGLILRKWRIHVLEPLLDVVLDTNLCEEEDKQALTVLVDSLKDMGIRKDDERSKQLDNICRPSVGG